MLFTAMGRAARKTTGLVLQGIVISCCLICAVLFCSAAWDYILQYWAAFAPHVLPPLDRVTLNPWYRAAAIASMNPNDMLTCRGLGAMGSCYSSTLSP